MRQVRENHSLGFLPAARKILTERTYLDLCRMQEQGRLGRRAISIVERWATNSPDLLREMDLNHSARTELKLFEQADLESEALDRPDAIQMFRNGWTQDEILKAMGVEIDLVSMALRYELV